MNIDKNRLILIAGPCAVENRETCFQIAEEAKSICDDLGIKYIFKASYKKANRTKLDSFSGIGMDASLNILEDVKKRYGVEILTDVHDVEDCRDFKLVQVVDYMQIPAFLCRQTELIQAAAINASKGITIKKGQFADATTMKYALEKARSETDKPIYLIERGNSFGYSDLVVDYTNIVKMKKFADVIMDCTHATQRPNQGDGVTGGNPEMIETLALCAIVSGADGLFIETHPDPSKAKSDGANMLQLDKLRPILEKCLEVKNTLNS